MYAWTRPLCALSASQSIFLISIKEQTLDQCHWTPVLSQLFLPKLAAEKKICRQLFTPGVFIF